MRRRVLVSGYFLAELRVTSRVSIYAVLESRSKEYLVLTLECPRISFPFKLDDKGTLIDSPVMH